MLRDKKVVRCLEVVSDGVSEVDDDTMTTMSSKMNNYTIFDEKVTMRKELKKAAAKKTHRQRKTGHWR